jgi:hypothetical protein
MAYPRGSLPMRERLSPVAWYSTAKAVSLQVPTSFARSSASAEGAAQATPSRTARSRSMMFLHSVGVQSTDDRTAALRLLECVGIDVQRLRVGSPRCLAEAACGEPMVERVHEGFALLRCPPDCNTWIGEAPSAQSAGGWRRRISQTSSFAVRDTGQSRSATRGRGGGSLAGVARGPRLRSTGAQARSVRDDSRVSSIRTTTWAACRRRCT